MFRKLKAHEIDCRVSTISAKGIMVLLYKDARCDMNILDETVGNRGWQRRHSRDNANCEVGVWDGDKKEWIWKEDTGTESFTEKAKGLASDSFKRACFNWGIGRELYTAPFIWIKDDGFVKSKKVNGKDKFYTYLKLVVDSITYDENGSINSVQISDDKGKLRYTHNISDAVVIKNDSVNEEYPTVLHKGVEVQGISLQQIMFIKEYFKGNETRYKQVLSFYEVTDVTGLPLTLANEIIEKIKLEKEGK